MPSVSRAQAGYVAAKAKEGVGWAKEWAEADRARGTKHLPRRINKAAFKPKAKVR